jgi:hypothetical protein
MVIDGRLSSRSRVGPTGGEFALAASRENSPGSVDIAQAIRITQYSIDLTGPTVSGAPCPPKLIYAAAAGPITGLWQVHCR